MAVNYPIKLDKGTSWKISCVYKDSNCVPINITGATFAGKIRLASAMGAVQGNFTFAITSASLGQFDVSLTNTETSALATGIHVYDVEMTLAGEVERLFEGSINARAEVTY